MFENLIRKMNQAADLLTALLLAIMTIAVLASIFGRYLFRIPVPAAVDAAYFSMLGCMFLQTGRALFEGKHVANTLLKDRLPIGVAAVLDFVAYAIVLMCCAVFVWYSIRFTWDSLARNWLYDGSLAMPMYIPYGLMFLGSLYLAMVAFLKIIENIIQIKRLRHGI